MKNYQNRLLQSQIIVEGDYWKKCFQTEEYEWSGLYLLYPKFEIKTGDQIYLKVGMTVGKRGLKGRIGSHYNSYVTIKNGRLKGNTVLGRHLYRDKTIGKKFGVDLTKQRGRQIFLIDQCFFKILPLKEFNWKNEEERKEKKVMLREIESSIEDSIRHQIRYIDEVVER